MRINIVIIAHNEELYIGKCIESLLNQTIKPEKIILVAHNCTDNTEKIATKYPIEMISYQGPKGIIYARLESLKYIDGDIVLCTDGDSYASKNWVEEMTKLLKQEKVLVGSWMKLKGTFFGWLSNFFNWYYCIRNKNKIERWIWGPSMGFWAKDKDFVREVFEKSITLSKFLGLTRNPDDFWLALFMKRKGSLGITNKTHVTQNTKETSTSEALKRNRENNLNAKIMEEYFYDKSPSL